MKATLQQILTWLGGATKSGDAQCVGVSTDSRNVAAGSLFVALRGERFDAHDFLAEIAQSGAAAVLAERVPEGFSLPTILVPDTHVALGELAAGWRAQFDLPVIGVTGSNGKTTVKEMIASILASAYGQDKFVATRGNLNNEIGVPLTVFRLNDATGAAVIELGMNHPGEIASLTRFARPTVALVNNAQREHQEFMESVAAVADENGAVLAGLPAHGIAVFPSDDPFTARWTELAAGRQCFKFGFDASADVSASFSFNAFGSDMVLKVQGVTIPVQLAAAGIHNVRNALAAAACTLAIGVPLDAVARGLSAFEPVSGRLQKKRAVNGAQVIDDTYNANPDSVRAAIDVLATCPIPRLLVLGDMGEVGVEGVRFHEEIGAYAAQRGIEQIFAHGDLMRFAVSAAGTNARHFDTMESLQEAVQQIATSDTTVLVKGSRFMRMERVVRRLIDDATHIVQPASGRPHSESH